MIIQLLGILAAVICFGFFLANKRPKNYPPGPIKFPIVGNLPTLKKIGKGGMSGLFTDLSKTYGPVFSFDFGSHWAVVLNDHKLIKEAFNNPGFCGRSRMFDLEARSGGSHRGVLFNEGPHHDEQRRFMIRTLKDFGFGKRSSMENLILDEVAILLDDFRKDAGTPFSTVVRFNASVLNALWMIVAGERFNHEDPEVLKLFTMFHTGVESSHGSKPLLYISWLNELAPSLTGWDAMKKALPVVYNTLTKISKRMLSDYDGDAPEYFAHAFIDEMRKCNEKSSSFFGEEGEKQFVTVLQDIFNGGADTTSTAMSWMFLYMAVYPDLQKRLCDEIDSVLKNRKPSIQDRYNMPFAEAVILETLRTRMGALGLWHRALESGYIGKYFIPKGTVLISNTNGVHHDPTIWDQPEVFNPDRFLNEDKTSIIKNIDGLFPFSVGKRSCPGESLAKDELFLFLTSVFREFSVTWDRSGPQPSLEPVNGVIPLPQRHKLIVHVRN